MGTPTLAQVVTAVERLAALAADSGLTSGPAAPERLVSDCLRVVYREVFADLAVRRGGVLSYAEAVASLALEVLDPGLLGERELAETARLLAVPGGTAAPADPVAALGALHEAMLVHRAVVETGRVRLRSTLAGEGSARKAAGAFFTPPSLVEWLLDHTLEPVLDDLEDAGRVTVLDPSCGPGAFLVAATRRLRRRGVPADRALACVSGVDVDAAALEIARACLWLESVEPGQPVAMPEPALRVGDALLDVDILAEGQFDVVIGNPPFLNQLERATTHRPGVAALLNDRSHGLLRPYTDVSAIFLQRSVGWARQGGRIGLVQPQSLLAARDAAGVRAFVSAGCALEALWASDVPVFEANVLTCAPVLRKDADQGPVRRFHGPSFEELEPRPDPQLGGGWSFLLAPGLGIPEVSLSQGHGVLADLAACTADFRDQYYGLAPYVHEADAAVSDHAAPLVTSGLIDPAASYWGQRSTRFLKRTWRAPVIDLDALRQDEKLHRWATRRLVPKVLVGTQGKVVEAVVDEEGAWLPSVPTITVVPDAAQLWHVLAVLLAPPVAAHAAATFAGTALSMRAIKLSATQVGQLPLPVDRDAWAQGAAAVRRAQRDPGRRREHLADAGRRMCEAYGCGDGTFEWWFARLNG